MPLDFLSLFALLNATWARYELVGGLAVVLHGVDRLTADVDLALDLTSGSVEQAVGALLGAGLQPMLPLDSRQLADGEVRRKWRNERGMEVFSFWDPSHTRPAVDIVVEPPVAFEDLWRDAREFQLDGVALRVASIAHLVALKRFAGRP